MTEKPRRPTAVRLDAPDVRVAEPGSDPPFLARATVVVPEATPPAITEPAPVAPARGGGFGALLWAAVGTLVSLAVTTAVWGLIDDLFARSPVLGWIGVAAAGVLLVAGLVVVGREVMALRRLGRVEALVETARRAQATDDRVLARALVADLDALYRGRPDMAEARATFARSTAGIMDGADLVRVTERTLMADLDRRAVTLVLDAAKRVSLVTAVAPRAVFDVAMVAYTSVRLVRQLAELYGARPGALGMWRLTRRVMGHLAVTGGMAIGESLVQQLVGHGLAAKLSAKLGEGVVNGLMTARVGLSTIDLVRPMPFAALDRPKLGTILAELTTLG